MFPLMYAVRQNWCWDSVYDRTLDGFMDDDWLAERLAEPEATSLSTPLSAVLSLAASLALFVFFVLGLALSFRSFSCFLLSKELRLEWKLES